MEKQVSVLIGLLKDENKILDNLIDLARSKSNILIEANVESLNKIVENEQNLKSKLEILERKRVSLAREIAGGFGEMGEVSLSHIAQNVEVASKIELEELQKDIKEQIKIYKQLNDVNIELIQHHLAYVDYIMNSIAGQKVQPSVYGGKGYRQEEKRRSFFDNRV